MYDFATQQWDSQAVSGELPNPSENLCVVGVPGDNGTYEVWNRVGTCSVSVTNQIRRYSPTEGRVLESIRSRRRRRLWKMALSMFLPFQHFDGLGKRRLIRSLVMNLAATLLVKGKWPSSEESP